MKILRASLVGFRSTRTIPGRWIALPLIFLSAGLLLVLPCVAAPFEFEQTGTLSTARELHTATLLSNGKALVVGGDNGGSLATAELYDPANGTWAASGSLGLARSRHTATLLPNGKVLIVGGSDDENNSLVSAELYDPASGTWTATGSLNTARRLHTATLVQNGMVLVAGGLDSNKTALASAERGHGQR